MADKIARVIKRKSNSDVEAGYLKVAQHQVPESRAQVDELKNRSQKVAGHKFFIMNWMFPDSRKEFPYEPGLRTVEKYFPYAEGGPLLIDEPERKDEIEDCKRKAAVLNKLGFRYLILKPGMSEWDAKAELDMGVN